MGKALEKMEIEAMIQDPVEFPSSFPAVSVSIYRENLQVNKIGVDLDLYMMIRRSERWYI